MIVVDESIRAKTTTIKTKMTNTDCGGIMGNLTKGLVVVEGFSYE
jgi:hypothetical protein